MESRTVLIERAAQRRVFSVVVIGAGINGIGVFRDLALQGVDCLIVDKEDFCCGASGASSRMIHGGLKYLETGELRLVAESILERNRLMRNASHLVRPLEVVLIFRSWLGGTVAAIKRFIGRPALLGGRGALIVRLGLLIFDLLGLRERATPRHRFFSRTALLKRFSWIDSTVVAGASYFDSCIAQPERLGVELVLDGINTNNKCMALNYVRFVSADGGELLLRDEIDGREFTISPAILVNATGGWIDITNRRLGLGGRSIAGTKGSHIILDSTELYERLGGCMICFDAGDGRECFAYPLFEKIVLGTTDLYSDEPDTARCDEGEIDYLLNALQSAFPTHTVSRDQIVFTYAGIRPLGYRPAADPGNLSRSHTIRTDERIPGRPFPIFSLIGGKWTTFRAFAEQATDLILSRLGRARQCSTRDLPIGGGRQFAVNASEQAALRSHLMSQFGVAEERAHRLVERYGSRSLEVGQYCRDGVDSPLLSLGTYTVREISFLVVHEMAQRAIDIVLRRTTMAVRGDISADLIEEIASVVGETVGWSEQRVCREIEMTVSLLANRNGVATDVLDETRRRQASERKGIQPQRSA